MSSINNRADGRAWNELRPLHTERRYLCHAEGSCLFSTGNTRVLCAATVEDRVPEFLVGSGQGWVTAEYAMLPKSTLTRIPRDRNKGGRAQEIQRLIGRSLRNIVDLHAIGERTITIDCDVIQADGGTRTASITGAMIALHDAITWMLECELIPRSPLQGLVASTSVGIVNGQCLLDLDYNEDRTAEVDFNMVMTDAGKFVELQGTAEEGPFDRNQLDKLLELGQYGINQLLSYQRQLLGL